MSTSPPLPSSPFSSSAPSVTLEDEGIHFLMKKLHDAAEGKLEMTEDAANPASQQIVSILNTVQFRDRRLEAAFRTATSNFAASYSLSPYSFRQILFPNSPVCGAAIRTLGNIFVDFDAFVETMERKPPLGVGARGSDGELDEVLKEILDEGTMGRLLEVCEETLRWALFLAGGGEVEKKEEAKKEDGQEGKKEGESQEEEGARKGGLRKQSMVQFADMVQKYQPRTSFSASSSSFSSSSSSSSSPPSSSSSSFSSSSSSPSPSSSVPSSYSSTPTQQSPLYGLFTTSNTSSTSMTTTYRSAVHPALGISFSRAFAVLSLILDAISSRPSLQPLLKIVWSMRMNSLYSSIRDFVNILHQHFSLDDTNSSVPLSIAIPCLHVLATSLQLTHQQCQQGVTIIDLHLPRFLYTPIFAKVYYDLSFSMNVPLGTEATLLLLGRHVDMCNHTIYCDEVVSFMDLEGFSRLMYSSPSLTSSGLWALENAVMRSERVAEGLVEKNALSLISPLLYESDFSIVALSMSVLAFVGLYRLTRDSIDDQIIHSLLQVCQMSSPIISKLAKQPQMSTITYNVDDIIAVTRLLSDDAPAYVRFVGSVRMASMAHSVSGKESLRQAPNSVLQSLRNIAISPDPFLYSLSVVCLEAMGEAIPSYRAEETKEKSLPQDINDWSIDHVCEWVGKQTFKGYRSCFRDGLVSGDVLGQLDDELLEEMGVEKKVHRLAVTSAIDRLKVLQEKELEMKGGKGKKEQQERDLLQSADSVMDILPVEQKKENMIDVFISYRRKGGSVLAHLLRRELQMSGLTVFLDVENLGTGDFRSSLLSNLKKSVNFLVLLTPGAVDRCKDDIDNKDFVHMEICAALKRKKNIVPIIEQGFEFPDEKERKTYPEDMRGLFDINGIEYNHFYMEATMIRIKSFLHPR